MQEIITARDCLIYFSKKHKGDWNKIYMEIKAHNAITEKPQLPEGVNAITILEMSERLQRIFNQQPFVLYYKGDIGLLEEAFDKGVGILGSRNATDYGLLKAVELSRYCAFSGYPVVCSLAKGIEEQAIRACLEVGGKPVVFLASSLDQIYPSELKGLAEEVAEKGLLITEYPPNTYITGDKVVRRSRLTGALPKVSVVIEADKRSGTMITVGFALNAGRDVGAVPTHVGKNDGANYLIQQGAYPVLKGEDIDTLLGSEKGEVQHGQINSSDQVGQC